MDSDKKEQLLNYLNSLGFYGHTFKEEILHHINSYESNFFVDHRIDFGEEAMLFRLKFERDQQFDAYRLVKYKATHRDALSIDHKTINGVDTAKLEQYMKIEDWPAYFSKNGDSRLREQDKASIQKTIDNLNKLSSGHNFDGLKIQQELMFKYWPDSVASIPDGNELKYLYLQSRDFHAGEFGCCNANLAFYIVSGKFDELVERLSRMELEEFPGLDIHPTLERLLSRNPDKLDLTFSHRQPEGIADYRITAQNVGNNFVPDFYQVSFTPLPELKHGIYNGVDSVSLEQIMQGIDWAKDQSLVIIRDDQEPDFAPQVTDVLLQLQQLATDAIGADVAHELQLKYWAETDMFNDWIFDSAWDYFRGLPQRNAEFPISTSAFAAYNLLAGRAVIEDFVFLLEEKSSQWIKMDFERSGPERFVKIDGYSTESFESTLGLLPLSNLNYYQIQNTLKRGGIAKATLKNDHQVLLEASPEDRTIKIYTPDRQPILANLHFDPDWQPGRIEQVQKLDKAEQKTEPTVNKRNPVRKRKGRGI